jgi:tetratricopeptide (TPR) repeat protein
MPIKSLTRLMFLFVVAFCLLPLALAKSPALRRHAAGPQQSGAGPAATSADQYDALARKAAAAREAGETSSAIQLYEAALKVRSDWTEGWWDLGLLYSESGRYSNAIPAFKQVVEASPKLGAAWAYLGLAQFETQDYQNSLTSLRRAQELGFADLPSVEKVASYHLALLLNWNGEFEDAWELLAAKFGNAPLADQTKVALALALLRVPLLPDQLDPSKDALIETAGETAAFLVQGNFDQALPLFERMLKDYPTTPFLHYAYGSALIFQARFDQAEQELRAETKITPESALPYVRLAIIGLKARRAAQALPDAEIAVKLAPQSSLAHQVLARVFTELGKTDKAAKELELANSLKPEKPQSDANVARVYSRAVVRVTAAASTTSSGNVDDLLRQASEAAKAGHADDAIQLYQHALAMQPNLASAWLDLGTVYYASGHYSDAISALKNAVAINPELAGAWVFLGLSEFETKDYKNAYIHLDRGGELNWHGTAQAQRIASYTLAQLRNLNSDFDSAIAVLKPEIQHAQLTEPMTVVLGMALLRIPLLVDQIDPASRDLLKKAGQTAAFMYSDKYNEAFQSFQEMIKEYPRTPYLHYAYASALERFSRYDEAESQLHQEIQIDAGRALPYMRLAAISLKVHKPDAAQPEAQRAVDLDPQTAGAHELLGRALLDLGKVEPAVKELEIAAKLAPNYPEVHFNLARAYARAKQPAQAEKERAIFAQLNASSEHQESAHNQIYGVPQSREPGGVTAPSAAKPD